MFRARILDDVHILEQGPLGSRSISSVTMGQPQFPASYSRPVAPILEGVGGGAGAGRRRPDVVAPPAFTALARPATCAAGLHRAGTGHDGQRAPAEYKSGPQMTVSSGWTFLLQHSYTAPGLASHPPRCPGQDPQQPAGRCRPPGPGWYWPRRSGMIMGAALLLEPGMRLQLFAGGVAFENDDHDRFLLINS